MLRNVNPRSKKAEYSYNGSSILCADRLSFIHDFGQQIH